MSASTALITDAGTMITNGPTATTSANAASGLSSASYPSAGICDYPGLLVEYRDRLKSIKELLTMLHNITDGSDPNATIMANALLTLS